MSTLLAERKGTVQSKAPPARTLIEVRDVSLRFVKLLVLDRMAVDVREGEFVSFLGPSGCGKSTLLKVIGGLIPVSEGEIRIRANGLRVGVMFQKPLLLPWRTTLSNVLLPLELGRETRLGPQALDKAHKMLELVRLADFADAYPHQLSGGMQQRAALARTLIQDPDVLLLDEPFGALDELTRELLNEELIAIWTGGATRLRAIVMVTHSIPEAVAMSDRVFIFSPRPARLVDVIGIPLAHPRNAESPDVTRFVAEARQLIRGTL
ncbi:MAG TPA: ABC transporter ATP-binding protein [Hyphomicrobiales bacterium]|nr:ABC transporter ATP-binding protein [Hyphomicrobiales bacterium]